MKTNLIKILTLALMTTACGKDDSNDGAVEVQEELRDAYDVQHFNDGQLSFEVKPAAKVIGTWYWPDAEPDREDGIFCGGYYVLTPKEGAVNTYILAIAGMESLSTDENGKVIKGDEANKPICDKQNGSYIMKTKGDTATLTRQ